MLDNHNIYVYFLTENEIVILTILKSEISQIYAHFGRTMPLLFLFCHGHACARIRSSLKMTSKNTGLWFDVDCSGKLLFIKIISSDTEIFYFF